MDLRFIVNFRLSCRRSAETPTLAADFFLRLVRCAPKMFYNFFSAVDFGCVCVYLLDGKLGPGFMRGELIFGSGILKDISTFTPVAGVVQMNIAIPRACGSPDIYFQREANHFGIITENK